MPPKMSADQRPDHVMVYNKDGQVSGCAKSTGYRCRMEGCTGVRLTVMWPDGRQTRPCTKGLFTRADGSLQIG